MGKIDVFNVCCMMVVNSIYCFSRRNLRGGIWIRVFVEVFFCWNCGFEGGRERERYSWEDRFD